MALAVGVLGPLVIEAGDRELGKLPRKARALLGYLAAQKGRPISRERLADLLWPYQESQQARHSLRNCLLILRKGLGAAALHLVVDPAGCRLEGAGVDLDRFERLARSSDRAELQAAADLYRGEFLADFSLESEPFEDWLVVERARTLTLACDVLQRLTRAHDTAGESHAAIQSGRTLVALDPFSEPGHRILMRAYANAGRRPEALRQYKSCAEILKRELAVAPDEETQALATEIARSARAGGLGVPARGAGTADQRPGTRARVGAFQQRGSSKWFATRTGAPRPSPPTGSSPGWPCISTGLVLAVAPLRNLLGDSAQQDLVEGFTDDLITDLLRRSRGISLARIAEGRDVTGLLSLADMPGIDYALIGSAQRGKPGTLRINLQLVDAVTAEYRWIGRYEFSVGELRAIQTEITGRISRELRLSLLLEANRNAVPGKDGAPGLIECLSRATAALNGSIRPDTTAEAQQWFLGALARDRRNVEALVGLALTCQYLASAPWWADVEAAAIAADIGREAVASALALAPGHALASCIDGMLCSAAGDLEGAVKAFERAQMADPQLPPAHAWPGYNSALLGRADRTLPAIERAMQLDKAERRLSIWAFFGGFTELLLGRTEEGIALLRRSLQYNPSYGAAQLFLAAALSASGRRDEAARAAAAFRDQYPSYGLDACEQQWLSRSTSPIYRAQINPLFDRLRALNLDGWIAGSHP